MSRTPANVLRSAAFTDPREVTQLGVLDETTLSDEQQLALAKAVGYPETPFLVPRDGADAEHDVRYWSPEVGLPLCGHRWDIRGREANRTTSPGPRACASERCMGDWI